MRFLFLDLAIFHEFIGFLISFFTVADTKGLFLTCLFYFILESLLWVDEQLKDGANKVLFLYIFILFPLIFL